MVKKKYKVSFYTEDEINAENEEEAQSVFWDRFDNSVWKANVEEIN